jgi:3-methylfumaryl-CoA hydratase
MNWENWIGRSAETSDWLTPAALARFCATLDQQAGNSAAPQGIHWCLCLPDAPTASLGADGHPRRDDSPESFMPPIPLPRRMWAASDVQFHAPILRGAKIRRTSTISKIAEKNGASGQLVFVTVAHETHADDLLAISESQSIVFREPAPAPAAPKAAEASSTKADLSAWQWHREILPNAALLFRYSALTFNSHRIHYDAPYATAEEGYDNLVVHGPLTATLLLDLAQRELGLNALKTFQMRAQSPAFVDQPLHLVGREDGEGGYTLAALGADGRTIMSASAR